VAFGKGRVEKVENGLDQRIVRVLKRRESKVDDVDSRREGSERSDDEGLRFRRRETKKRLFGEERSSEGDFGRSVRVGSDDGRSRWWCRGNGF